MYDLSLQVLDHGLIEKKQSLPLPSRREKTWIILKWHFLFFFSISNVDSIAFPELLTLIVADLQVWSLVWKNMHEKDKKIREEEKNWIYSFIFIAVCIFTVEEIFFIIVYFRCHYNAQKTETR